LGGASAWWLAQSLRALSQSLDAIGNSLLVLHGKAAEQILTLAQRICARGVYWNDVAYSPHRDIAKAIKRRLDRLDIIWREFQGDLLFDPETIRTASDHGFRVFTPFWRRLLVERDPPSPLPAPSSLMAGPKLVGATIDGLGLEPKHPDWAGGLRATWKVGEQSALLRLSRFLTKDIASYCVDRDRPDRAVTSRLSPHLRFGEVGPRQVWHGARFAASERPRLARDVEKLLSEIGWREFCRHLLFDVPDLSESPLRPEFRAFPWEMDRNLLHAWQRGRTGYPVVDAGMRELWQTGTMHNRVRMVVASFLVKHLLVDWRIGENWFWDTLVDADPASNPANWQWVAGCGADAAPYFRIFNPVLQGEKFDPEGAYVRRWLPELIKLPNDLIHSPWRGTESELTDAGVRLGQTYPRPIVDHAAARIQALAAYNRLRLGSTEAT